MSIVRVNHDRENPYAQIRRNTIRDTRLGMECLGLLVYLLSMSENWHVSTAALAKTWGLNIDTIKKRLAHLIELGYCKREQSRENGKFGEMDYVIYEEPQRISNNFSEEEKTVDGKIPPKERTRRFSSYKKEEQQQGLRKKTAQAPVVVSPKEAKKEVIREPEYQPPPTPYWDSIDLAPTKKEKILKEYKRSVEEIENAAMAFKQQASSGKIRAPIALLRSLLRDRASPNPVSKKEQEEQRESDREILAKRAQRNYREYARLYADAKPPKYATLSFNESGVYYSFPKSHGSAIIAFVDEDFWPRVTDMLQQMRVKTHVQK